MGDVTRSSTVRRRLNRLRFKTTRWLHDLDWKVRGSDAALHRIDRHLHLADRWFWLFGLGVNNSGTTILYALLRRHPEFRVLPKEGHRLTDALTHPAELGISRMWSRDLDRFHMTEADDPTPAAKARYDWLHYFERRPGILFEKSPPNTVRSRWLAANFSPARFLVIFRDPYAVAEGVRRRVEGVDIREAARHWALGNGTLLDDLEHIDPNVVHRLTYEDLCEQGETELERLEKFLGLTVPIDRAVLRQPLTSRNVDGVSQPLTNYNARSHERLSAEDIAIINDEAGDVIDRLGYPRL